MKEPVKFGVILLIFCAISAGLLALVNSFTAPIISRAELADTFTSYEAIFGDEANNFEILDDSELSAIQESYPQVENIFVAMKDDEIVGYGINISVNGFGGSMTNAMGISLDGNVVAGFRNISNSETKGFGTLIEEEPYYSSYVGKTTDQGLQMSTEPSAENEVLQLSGATITSKAVLEGSNIAIEVYDNFLNK